MTLLWKASDKWQQSGRLSRGTKTLFMMSDTRFHVDWVRFRCHSNFNCELLIWILLELGKKEEPRICGWGWFSLYFGLPCQTLAVLFNKFRSSCVRGYVVPSGPTSEDALPAHLSAVPLKVRVGWPPMLSPFWSLQVSLYRYHSKSVPLCILYLVKKLVRSKFLGFLS